MLAYCRNLPKIISLRRKSYNINDKLIAWIRDFLCRPNLSIGLCVNGEFSTGSEVLSGIPQGSILGPLLFRFHARCRKRRLNLTLVFCLNFMLLYVLLCVHV